VCSKSTEYLATYSERVVTMKILALGGTGRKGRLTTSILAEIDLVTEIIISSRQREVAERATAELGEKATAVQVDITDKERLTSLMASCDIVVNTCGPYYQVQFPCVQGAIRAGTHYCDISEDGRSTQQVLALDAEAKAAGVTALIGIGGAPGGTNLLAKHAHNQLDELEEIQICVIGRGDLAGWRNASMHAILQAASGKIPTYQDGDWIDIDSSENCTDVIFPGGSVVRAYPSGMAEPVTLPHHLTGVRTVSSLYGFLPPRVGDLFHTQVRRITAGEIDVPQAFEALYEAIDNEPEESLKVPEGVPPIPALVTALGRREGRRIRYICVPTAGSTEAVLVAATLRILRGEISERGVIPPEACLDPLPFFDDIIHLLPEAQRPPEGKSIMESFEWLD
jgi:saccharopine dehydrogenase-like NADP-dependent oxidoreductase